jgi:catechol 2,3-dioxygenase-like lactoylglutathione lyase family enzyme
MVVVAIGVISAMTLATFVRTTAPAPLAVALRWGLVGYAGLFGVTLGRTTAGLAPVDLLDASTLGYLLAAALLAAPAVAAVAAHHRHPRERTATMRIGLVSIYVDDQDQAERFYTQTLGFQVTQQRPAGYPGATPSGSRPGGGVRQGPGPHALRRHGRGVRPTADPRPESVGAGSRAQERTGPWAGHGIPTATRWDPDRPKVRPRRPPVDGRWGSNGATHIQATAPRRQEER